MKRIILLLLIAVMTLGIAYAADDKDITFAEKSYDFGTVKADAPTVEHEYIFTNNADVPLTIMSASATCGCTRAKYTSEPVKPGEQGKIIVTFMPKGQRGFISKNVKVRYKVSGKKVKNLTLKISGNVTP